MPRKTRRDLGKQVGVGRRFNEAAARCRGKRTRFGRIRSGGIFASMRPRPDAAENPGAVDAARHRSGYASMRPRPDAAENLMLTAKTTVGAVLQ